MKNQYFCDINDYRKYGLLRVLSNNSMLRIAVCWMLTENDRGNDGNKTTYLSKPEQWRHYDPKLFDALRDMLHHSGKRTVQQIEQGNNIPGATFFSSILTDDNKQREQYFSELLVHSPQTDLVFVDPDNGIEVRSKKYGAANSCKYIYWHELSAIYHAGNSLLIYQHFPRVEHVKYTRMKAESIQQQLQSNEVISIATSSVVYFLIPQERHKKYIQQRIEVLKQCWGNQFIVTLHT